jgi:hypothetical protein
MRKPRFLPNPQGFTPCPGFLAISTASLPELKVNSLCQGPRKRRESLLVRGFGQFLGRFFIWMQDTRHGKNPRKIYIAMNTVSVYPEVNLVTGSENPYTVLFAQVFTKKAPSFMSRGCGNTIPSGNTAHTECRCFQSLGSRAPCHV